MHHSCILDGPIYIWPLKASCGGSLTWPAFDEVPSPALRGEVVGVFRGLGPEAPEAKVGVAFPPVVTLPVDAMVTTSKNCFCKEK